ncbi:unnamed protein product [Dovyalis caffra]|uniref:Uncharacterized protein n=1 Tax=Dovyalis caffra TaxID=77055 RepID=A0AAV1RTN7_9ROSI|nr:unnamed protein product [Dovyalis caffra]
MKKIIVAVLIVSMILSHFESVESGPGDCLDACQTACVQPNTRLMQRCDRKCQIRCDPDPKVDHHMG